ncbi:MAG: prolipoprotein diacylglyceryl transferase [Clostridia bacterium]|nr:prolipoprotein diacylglyceryl transferase [Clostridia bacterium]
MLPVLHLFGRSLSSYLLMAAAAGVLFWSLSACAMKRDIPSRMRILLPPAVILSALFGARLLHAALNPGRYGENYPVWSLRYDRLSLMGGLILGTLVLYAVCRELDLPFFRVSDDLTAGTGIALTVLKVGCFLNGCCAGSQTASRLGMVFPAHEVVYDLLNTPPEARRVWPVQLFECVAYLAGIIVLLLLRKKKKWPEGVPFLAYAGWVCAVRFALYSLRAAVYSMPAKVFYPLLYPILLAACAALLIRQIRRERRSR